MYFRVLLIVGPFYCLMCGCLDLGCLDVWSFGFVFFFIFGCLDCCRKSEASHGHTALEAQRCQDHGQRFLPDQWCISCAIHGPPEADHEPWLSCARVLRRQLDENLALCLTIEECTFHVRPPTWPCADRVLDDHGWPVETAPIALRSMEA